MEQLAEAMFALAKMLETDVDAFAQAYEPEIPPEIPEDMGEMELCLRSWKRWRRNELPKLKAA